MTYTRRMAEFAAETPTAEIPAAALEAARLACQDTVGCALAGAVEPAGTIAAAWVRETGARKTATVWGHALRTSAAEAAFANGIASHALDYDDSLPSLHGHPSATIAPAVLAVGEATGSSGRDVLAAYAVGVEIAGKIALALGPGHYLHGWHFTATAGAFAATAAAARLLNMDASALQAAWGLTASQTAGLTRNFGTMTKPFHAGHAARTGVASAWLARAGFSANTTIFDGAKSVIFTYGKGDGDTLDTLVGRLGQPWEIIEPGIYVKRWPCCYCNHRPLGGLLKLIAEHGIRADEVESVEIGFVLGSDEALQDALPETGLEGKFSIEYVAAAALLDGTVGLETFTDAMVQRPQARALMKKVRRYRVDDPKRYSSKFGYSDLAISTPRGRFTLRVEHVSGSPQWPMTEAERNEKFMDTATRALDRRRAQVLLDGFSRFHRLRTIRSLMKTTQPAATAH